MKFNNQTVVDVLNFFKIFVSKKLSLNNQLIRFLISGGSAAVVDLSVLFLLVEIFNVWYVVSVVIAFLVALLVSFTLQKYWTFKNMDTKKILWQGPIFFAIQSINFVINTLGVIFFVEYIDLHPVLSQVIVGFLLAISSYFIFSRFIFRTL